jgi:protease PrsW
MVSEAYSFSSVGVIIVDYAFPFTVVVAAIYLAIVRFMDLNEKEPIWALGLMLVLGIVAAMIVDLLVSDVLLGPYPLWQSLIEETAKFVAFYLGAVALTAVARMRGWLEINDLMDGIVYGTAVGLGFAVGETFVREYLFGQIYQIREPGLLAELGTTSLAGLSEGLFGAIIGAGFGAAVGAHTALRRVGYIVAGLIGAILTHWLYEFLAHGGPLGGTASLVRTWIALLIPLLFVIGVAGFALFREKQVIREELADESQTGAVTEEELAVLTSSLARRSHRTRASWWKLVAGYTRFESGVKSPRMPQRDGSMVGLVGRTEPLGGRFRRCPDLHGRSHLEVPPLRYRHSHQPHSGLRFPHLVASGSVLRRRDVNGGDLQNTYRPRGAAPTSHRSLHPGDSSAVDPPEASYPVLHRQALLQKEVQRRQDA